MLITERKIAAQKHTAAQQQCIQAFDVKRLHVEFPFQEDKSYAIVYRERKKIGDRRAENALVCFCEKIIQG